MILGGLTGSFFQSPKPSLFQFLSGGGGAGIVDFTHGATNLPLVLYQFDTCTSLPSQADFLECSFSQLTARVYFLADLSLSPLSTLRWRGYTRVYKLQLANATTAIGSTLLSLGQTEVFKSIFLLPQSGLVTKFLSARD